MNIKNQNKQRSNVATHIATFGKFFTRLLIASAVTFLLASIFHTQSVLAGLIDLGIHIPLATRLETVLADLAGLVFSYGVIVLVGMFIAMNIATWISNLLKKRWHVEPTLWLFVLAGAVAMFTILAAMHPILNVTIIAGARGLSGLITQSIAGAVGGFAFAALKKYF